MPLTFLLVPLGFGLIALGFIHPWLAMPFVGLYRVLLWLLIKPVVWMAEITDGWAWTVGSPPIWVIWVMYAGLLLLVTRRQAAAAAAMMAARVWEFPARGGNVQSMHRYLNARLKRNTSRKLLIAAVSAAGLLAASIFLYAWPSHELRVTFVDVGQGDCALIEGPEGTRILVDGGGIPSYLHSDFDVGEKTVLPFLRHRGVRTLDYVVATHADEDHVRGLLSVLQKTKVRNLVVSGYDDPAPAFQELLRTARLAGIPIYREQSGISWQLETGLSWRFLHPDAIHKGTRSDTNANSVVFELDYGSRRFLFTGDIEGEVESDLLAGARQVDVLKVAHHGSVYSTTDQFLQQVHPQYAIISAGKRNRYGHPHQATLDRLRQLGAKVYRTDQQGAITVRTDGTQLRVDTAIN
jgi:competence protein ComEC